MTDEEPFVRIRGLTREHAPRRGGKAVHALAGVDLELARGSAVALVGRSGAGKSTVARCLARLEKPTAGTIHFEGQDIWSLEGSALRAFRSAVQLVLQDSAAALDPGQTAGAIVSEPLEILRRGDAASRRARADELMESVGLAPNWRTRRPGELSGGQRQRLALARALAVEPRLLILDESFAGLDPSVQAQMAELLRTLRARRGLTYLFVSHDLALMASCADDAAVMHEGRIVERASVARLFSSAARPETRALVDSIPRLPPLAPARAPA
jgi:ABC-type glutathione transport system ATPase component